MKISITAGGPLVIIKASRIVGLISISLSKYDDISVIYFSHGHLNFFFLESSAVTSGVATPNIDRSILVDHWVLVPTSI